MISTYVVLMLVGVICLSVITPGLKVCIAQKSYLHWFCVKSLFLAGETNFALAGCIVDIKFVSLTAEIYLEPSKTK